MPVSARQVPLELVIRHVEVPEAVRAKVRRLAAKLQTFDPDLLACRVVVDGPRRFAKGTVAEYRVGVRLTLPTADVVIGRQRDADLDIAIQAAFAAAGRRLQDAARLRRGEVRRRVPSPRRRGSGD